MKKSGLTAFFLGIIPGMGHLYLRKFGRGFLYPIVVISIFAFFFMVGVVDGNFNWVVLGLGVCFVVWLISVIDVVITILSRPEQLLQVSSSASAEPASSPQQPYESASGATIALAFIPGLGHMHMGLMYRGLTFLIGFFGIFTLVFFVTALSNSDDFLIFLGVLPILWVYNLFDAIQLYHRKNRGETLVDRTVFEDLLDQREQGHKSKMLAMFLSILPGAGHMYLGLQRRGLQLMAGFLLSVYILDVLHLSIFLFFIPLLWCFSFFDALQQVSRYEQGTAQDVPIIDWLMNHQRWIGIGLLALGLFYIFDNVAVPMLGEFFDVTRVRIWYDRYFQTTLVSLVLIVGGIKLLAGSKKKDGDAK